MTDEEDRILPPRRSRDSQTTPVPQAEPPTPGRGAADAPGLPLERGADVGGPRRRRQDVVPPAPRFGAFARVDEGLSRGIARHDARGPRSGPAFRIPGGQ